METSKKQKGEKGSKTSPGYSISVRRQTRGGDDLHATWKKKMLGEKRGLAHQNYRRKHGANTVEAGEAS